MGSLDITIKRDGTGNWNTSDVKAFLRSAGGIGSAGYVAHTNWLKETKNLTWRLLV